MRLRWQAELPQWLIIIAMFVVAAVLWSSTPARVPVHWNASGQVNGYGGRFEGLLLLPLIAVGLYLLPLFIPRIDPGKANYTQFASAYVVVRFTVLVMMAGFYAFSLLAVRGVKIDITRAFVGVIAVMFIVLGNVLGKVRPNWFVGVRTPWTLSSKRSWVRTHRLAGRLFALTGLIFLILALVGIGPAIFWILMAVLGVVTTILVAYSYVEWRHDPEKLPPAGTSPG